VAMAFWSHRRACSRHSCMVTAMVLDIQRVESMHGEPITESHRSDFSRTDGWCG